LNPRGHGVNFPGIPGIPKVLPFIQTQLGRHGLQIKSSLIPTSYSSVEVLTLCIPTTGKPTLNRTVYTAEIFCPLLGQVAPLQVDAGVAIALGNYASDHHYPGVNFPLKQKIHPLGGRWTVTYSCLIPAQMDGLLVCENISGVSHCQWCY